MVSISTVSENSRFCVANFAILSDERRSHSKIVLLFNMKKNLAFENLKGLHLGFRKLKHFWYHSNLLLL